jgi:HEAT repeat protein/energy-coupling factor transporter ATP-binding protein EcfA2
MLEAEKQLTTNQLMRDDDERFDIDDIHVPLALVERKKPNLIGDNTQAEQGSRLYEPEYEEKKRFEHEQFLLDILKDGKGKHNGKRIAIIGEPGAGKTTLLRTIAFWIGEKTDILPISISLADLQEFTLEDYLLRVWLKTALKVRQITPEMEDALCELFKSEQVWLLLDGVDEMPVQGEEPLRTISNQLKGWLGQARVVLTCRLNVWEANRNVLADNFEIYRTLEFSYGDRTMPDRVQEFIAKWFNKQQNLGQQLRQALDEPGKERIKDLAKNPLRLALLCSTWNLWRDRGGLPDTKAKLYQGFVEKFYEWKSREFPTNSTQRDQLNRALGELAKLAIDQTASRFRLKHSEICPLLGKPDKGLFKLALQLGWLNKVGLAAESPDETVYAFRHTTFEEYFAALAVGDRDFFLPRNHIDRPVKDQDHPQQYKPYRIFEPQWKEVILLWLGRDEQIINKQKEEFITALVEFEDGIEHEFYGYRAYFLAAVLIGEFKEYYLSDEIIEKIVILGFSYCQIERLDYLRFIDPFAEGARAVLLETNRTIAIEFLVNLIPIVNESTRWRAAFTLGQIDRGNEQAIDELIRALESTKDEYTRKIIAESLEQISIGNETAIAKFIRILAATEDEDMRNSVASILSKNAIHNELAISNLFKVLESTQDEHTRWNIADIVGDIAMNEQWVIERSIQILVSTDDQSIRSVYKFILSTIAVSNNKAINELIKIIKFNKNIEIRWSAIAILGGIAINHEVAISTLVTVLESAKDGRLFSIAAFSLGQIAIGNNVAIVALTKVLESTDRDKYTRNNAARSLGQIAIENEQVIAALTRVLESINEEDKDARMTVAESLRKINLGNELAIPEFIRIIKSNKYEYLRDGAIYSLGQTAIGNKQAIITLIQSLEFTENENTRRIATDSLEKIALDDEYAITELIRIMEFNKNESTRRSVADILGKIVTEQQWVFTHLIRVIESTEYEDNRWNVAEIFGKIALDNRQVISELIRIIEFNKNESIIKISAFCLGKIATGDQKAVATLIKVMKATKYENVTSIVASNDRI